MTWSSSNPSGLTISSSGSATRVGAFKGKVTLTATMTLASGCGTTAVKKIVEVGQPVITGAGSYQFSECTYQAYIGVQPGYSATWSVVSGSVSLGSTTGYSVYASSTTGGVIEVYLTNACGNSTPQQFYIPGCESSMLVYPNPAKGKFFVDFGKSLSLESLPTQLNLFSESSTNPVRTVHISQEHSQGRLIDGKLEIDVSDIKSGIYYLHSTYADDKGRNSRVRILID